MSRVHLLRDGNTVTWTIPSLEPLRLEAGGAIADGNEWVASFVPIRGASTRTGVAVVVRPEARVLVGARLVGDVAELRDGDRLLLGDLEVIYDDDALPIPLEASLGASCALCCNTERPLFLCPRCGAAACEACWSSMPEVCSTPGCPQPAPLQRDLARPAPEDFLGFEDGGME